ncbi:hypothetical protein [Streptomyces melanogenes]|uniref:Uncharacterized protein n=1 Tax=Streptomyces melanogenes TaxID=67326 RepID=A0ABZ1XPB0_9ACTN|nr:hypothetical protein [Streptomyces melanogenes]
MSFSVVIDTKYEEEATPPASKLYAALADLHHEVHFTEYLRARLPLSDQAKALCPSQRCPGTPPPARDAGRGSKPLALEEFHLPGDELELSYAL